MEENAIQEVHTKLLKKKQRLTKQLSDTENEIQQLFGETEVVCTGSILGKGCLTTHLIKNLVYIQTFYYIPPRGCSDGDYYKAGEGQTDCPFCGNRIRLCYQPNAEHRKRSFKSVKEEYYD